MKTKQAHFYVCLTSSSDGNILLCLYNFSKFLLLSQYFFVCLSLFCLFLGTYPKRRVTFDTMI